MITLALMVLLLLLVVGLVSLSNVVLRASSQGSSIILARNNARIALLIALNQLQKAAGNDQRITATADFAGDTGGLRLDNGKAPKNASSIGGIANGLTQLRPGTRYWTGVWNTVTASAPATDIYTKTPSATGVQWLISGNEWDPTTPQKYDPSSQVCALGANGTVSDPESAVVLVGPGSVGPAAPTTLNNYVSAPLVPVTLKNPLGGDSLGRYAWWVGDEGVKASFNRVAPTSAKDSVTYETLASQRAGWEVVSQLSSYPTPESNSHGLLERVVTLPEAKLLHSSLETSSGSPVALLHMATTDSFGVLADTLQSGLRLDLTAYLAKGFPTSTQSSFPNAPKQGANIIPQVNDKTQKLTSNLKGPKWDVLRTYSTLLKNITDGKITVRAATKNTEITIAPVIVDLRLLMGVKVVSVDSSTYKLNPCGKIAVSLANPYPYTLQWKSNLELEIIDETPVENDRDTRIWDASGLSAFLSNKGQPAVFNKAVFVIAPGELAAGEAKAYTMAAPVVRPANDTTPIRVDLKLFSSSAPAVFSNCIIQLDDTNNSGGKGLDVRESWTTSQPSAELRLASGSSGGLLRRLDRFELDNGFFASVRRGIDNSTASSMTEPFPMHLYSFQMSQPGADYASLLPAGNDLMGTRSSTLRTFTDFNLQAVRFPKLITSYNPPPYFMESSDSLASLPFAPPGGETGIGFTRNLAVSPLAWGRSPVGSTKKTVLFGLPKTLVSLAQLQHLDLTANDEFISVSPQPGNAVGNSYATPFVKRKNVIQSRRNYVVTGRGGGPDQTASTTNGLVVSSDVKVNYYDISYLLNATLWDTFFFSTLSDGTDAQPLNKSMTIVNRPPGAASLSDPVNASSYLMVRGAFNVNSVNKDAWKALLAGNRFLKHPADTSGNAPSDALFPRSLEQPSSSSSPPTGTGNDSFSGYRRLTNAQIDALAEEIVKQVRLRGPFVSLSHFINRTLIDLGSSNTQAATVSRSGPLQSAIDISGLNISPDGNKSVFSKGLTVADDKLKLQIDMNAPKADLWGTQVNGSRGSTYGGKSDEEFPVWAQESKDLNFGAVASILADRSMLTDSKLIQEQGFRSTGIPGWLTQADVLQVIGPSIAVRSDTFRIRAYGEALSPDGKTVLAKAWCEAIVQRVPSYIDPTDTPAERTTDLTKLNTLFGRRFEIVSFRWLSENEI